ncbi:MAG: multidrug effflux MFS transporter [Deltaproteobacteria bacterium]|jgi:DHA1 family bicyclomycin/chloramphenicol resistance-like MFS transporter|nr:multidrug effflux MFS transporter [Deltaproteobacteria bacterium]
MRASVNGSRTTTFKLTALLGLLIAFAPFSTDLFLAAFPRMAADMGVAVPQVQLTLSVFFAGLALGQLAYGPLSDRCGRKKPLLAGIFIYILASLGLTFCRDLNLFLLLRFFQAIGGCAGMVIARAVVRDSYDTRGGAKVLTVIMAVQSIGPVAAPVLGAYLISLTHWGFCFAFMTLLGIVCFFLVLFTLRESLPRAKRVKSSFLSVIARGGRLCRDRNFILVAVAGAVGGGSIFSFISGSPHVLMDYYGFTNTQYGWTFGIFSLGVALLSQLNLLFLKRFSARAILVGGLVATFATGGALTLWAQIGGLPPTLPFLALLFFSLVSLPFIVANSVALAMESCGENAGTASSLIGVLQFSAAALVSSLLGVTEGWVALPMAFWIMACGLLPLFLLWPRGRAKPPLAA